MDDEAPICELAAELLSREGFFVATAADGDAALRAYSEAKDSGQPFDVVILDLTVRGGMGGRGNGAAFAGNRPGGARHRVERLFARPDDEPVP